jgi:hypothetical protein
MQVFLISIEVDDSRGGWRSIFATFLSSEELPSLCGTEIQVASDIVE